MDLEKSAANQMMIADLFVGHCEAAVATRDYTEAKAWLDASRLVRRAAMILSDAAFKIEHEPRQPVTVMFPELV